MIATAHASLKVEQPVLTLIDRLALACGFVERWLVWAMPGSDTEPSARLEQAMHDAVFPGGKRLRPLLVRFIAEVYGQGELELVGRMASAVELIHCASLVHDDLPAFDDADQRRGRPTCHAAFGEATAILVGDALLALAFEILAQSPIDQAPAALRLTRLLGSSTGFCGIIGGQSLELQPGASVDEYHRRKTGALFVAAAVGGAIAAGAEKDIARWRRFGELIGRALQLRDDLDDVLATPEAIGKPVGRDAACGRPNAVHAASPREVEGALCDSLAEAEALLYAFGDEAAPLRYLIQVIGGPYVQSQSAPAEMHG